VRVKSLSLRFGVKRNFNKQMFHKDGPTMFSPLQFDEKGNIRTNAPAKGNRTAHLPPGNARSGLFALYTRTFAIAAQR
jgi:hypothetical protein